MDEIRKLVDALQGVLDLVDNAGMPCTCKDDYICRICRSRLALLDAKALLERGTFEGVRPRRRIRCKTTGEEFETLKDASLRYGIQSASISKCCKGEIKRAGFWCGKKMEWEYV